jgi:S-methylmethionine-dependent homocysteine/selenocysteine methylase
MQIKTSLKRKRKSNTFRNVLLLDLWGRTVSYFAHIFPSLTNIKGAILANGAEFRGDYVGHMTAEQLKEFHRPRVRALLQG